MNDLEENIPTEPITWVRWLARMGYAAKGLVYITIGILAVQVATGSGGKTTGPSGALDSLANQPFGQIFLGVMAIGLFGYTLWRFVQAWIDPEDEGTDAVGLIKRGAYVVSGVVYASFGIEALDLALDAFNRADGGDGDDTAREGVAWLMSQPYGIWLVGFVGLIVVGTGLYQFYRAYTAKFREELKLQEMNSHEQRWATRAGRIGFTSRGIVYSIIGGFILLSAQQADPEEAVGIGDSLQSLIQQPFGPWLLGIVALGLVGYGLFALVLARYRRIM